MPGSRTGRAHAGRAALAAACVGLAGVCSAAPAAAPAAAGSDAPPSAAIVNPGSQPATATDADATPSPISDRFALRAIWFYPQMHTQLRLDPAGQPGAGTTLSGEQDLGYGSHDNDGRLELMFRLRRKSRVRVDYLYIKRSGNVTLAQPVVYGNLQFHAGDTVNTSLTGRILGFTYTWAFVQTNRFELGAGASVYLLDGDARGTDPARLATEERSVAGAAPAPAVEAAWRISSRFALTARASYLSATIDNVSGGLSDFHADVQYRWQPNFAVGLGYTYSQVHVNDESGSAPGLLDIRLTGPELFLRASF